MATAFYSTAQGDPTRFLFRVAQQTTKGLPSETSAVDAKVAGLTGGLSPTVVRRLGLAGSAMPQADLPGKTDVTPVNVNFGDLDPANTAQIWALGNYFQYVTTSNPSGAAYRHRISQAQSAGSSFDKYLTVLVDHDYGQPIRYIDGMVSNWSLSAGPRQNVHLQATIMPSKFDFHGAVSQTTGSGSTLPIFRHSWSGNHVADGTDKDIYAKYNSAGGGTWQWKVASGGTLSSTNAISHGTWLDCYEASDAKIGNEAEQVQMYMQGTPTLTDGDIFKVLMRRARWTPSYSTEYSLPEVNAKLYLDGTERTAIEGGWTITGAGINVQRLEDTGGYQGTGVRKTGTQQVTLQLERDFIDVTLQRKNLERTNIGVVITIKSDTVIGATTYPYSCTIVMPRLRLQGPTYTVGSNADNRSESYTLLATEATSALTYSAMDFTADCEFVFDNATTTVA